MRSDTADYRKLFLDGVPLLDARAPVEFARGAFPGASNLPLMTDDERRQVGLRYKEQGQDAAIALGHRLVSGETKAARVEAWARFARAHPDGYLYCFRGGLRSQIVQQWLRDEAGIAYPRVVGGYKAMRTYLMEALTAAVDECEWMVLGGLTGSGKTELIAASGAGIDLEGHAVHRGSSFGRRAMPQPTQIDFETRLAIDVLRRRAEGHARLIVEDEGRFIGSRDVPLALYQRMQRSPVVWIEESFEARVTRVLQDYVVGLSAEFMEARGREAGFATFAQRLSQALAHIERRLGGTRYLRLSAMLAQALTRQAQHGDVHAHRVWITVLLQQYYDPMYVHQRAKIEPRIVFRGTRPEVLAYLQERTHATA